MESAAFRANDLLRLLVSGWYAGCVVAIPIFAFALELWARSLDPVPQSDPVWRFHVLMPSWYIVGYLCVLAGGIFVIPSAFVRSRILGCVVLLVMLASVIGMLPVIFVSRL